MQIDIRGLAVSYGELEVFGNLNLSIAEHRITCLTGPSGCGKTTLLRALAGLVEPREGSITPKPGGDISYLFQDALLLPWMNVLDNVCYLMDRQHSPQMKKERGLELIKRIGLRGFERHYPHELSGGMARRVSFARALGKPSSLFLMDEPFYSIDEKLKQDMIDLMKELLSEEKRTVFCITHDLSVARRFADETHSFEDLIGGA